MSGGRDAEVREKAQSWAEHALWEWGRKLPETRLRPEELFDLRDSIARVVEQAVTEAQAAMEPPRP